MAALNPVLAQMAAHASCRRFAPAAVPAELVQRVVAAAQCASTSSHVQAYALIRVDDAQRRARLRVLCGDQVQVTASGAFFVVCADQRRHALAAHDAGTGFVANLESFLVAVIDASLFAQNLALGFESEGLGVCFIGALRNHPREVDECLALPHGAFPLFGLCVGVPAPEHERRPRPRLPLPGVLFADGYASDERLRAAMHELDGALAPEFAARGMPGHTWTGGIARKYARAARVELADYYRAKGAVLE